MGSRQSGPVYGEGLDQWGKMPEKLAESLERRTQMAEQKIAQAETAAMKEVRAVASELAIDAAGKIIAGEVKGAKATSLIDESIAAVKNKLN